MLNSIMDPIMSPLLQLPDLVSVILISLLISVIITVIYKFTTNQNLMKQLKTEMKELQKEMKELRDKPEEMMKVNKKVMERNMKYMMQSFRSTIFTILPIILIFSWMNAHYAFESISPGEQFQITLNFPGNSFGNVSVVPPSGIEVMGGSVQELKDGEAKFIFRGQEGRYTEGNALEFMYSDKSAFKDVIITEGAEYAEKNKKDVPDPLKSISIDYNKKIILPVLNWGWLGSYIIFSIVFSMILRKSMKVY